MSNFELEERKLIPYYDEMGNSFFINIKKEARVRNKSVFSYLFYKFNLIMLQAMAKKCPINKFRVIFQKWRGVHIGENVYIGKNVYIDNFYPNFVYLHDGVSLHAECMIISHFNPSYRFHNLFEASASPVVINNGAIVGIRAVVMPGVTLGECAVVTAGSVVMKNVAKYTLVQGNPAKRILNFEHILDQPS
jgi:acetyltransferase-like isoleucine patch superfamily enzyme